MSDDEQSLVIATVSLVLMLVLRRRVTRSLQALMVSSLQVSSGAAQRIAVASFVLGSALAVAGAAMLLAASP